MYCPSPTAPSSVCCSSYTPLDPLIIKLLTTPDIHWLSLVTTLWPEVCVDVPSSLIMSPPPLGQGGYLDWLWFPVTPMCVGIRVHMCQTLFTWYFLQFFTNCFQILRYGDQGEDLELINFSWPCLNRQGHRGSLCFKLFIFLCNSKTIEASTFAGNTLLCYFLV